MVSAPRSLFGPLVAPLGLPWFLAYCLEACLPLVVASGVATAMTRGAEGPFPEGPSWVGHLPGAMIGLQLSFLLSGLACLPLVALCALAWGPIGQLSTSSLGVLAALQVAIQIRLILFFQQAQVLEGLGMRAALARSWSLGRRLHQHLPYALLLEALYGGALLALWALHGLAGDLLPGACHGLAGWVLRTLGHLANVWVAAAITARYLATRDQG